MNGRFGPYISAEGKNVKIPKDVQPVDLSFDEVMKLVADAPEPKGRFAKKAAPKAAATKVTKPKAAPKAKTTAAKAKTTTVKKAVAKKK